MLKEEGLQSPKQAIDPNPILEDISVPLFCQPGVNPSQSLTTFDHIRIFSDFDSGNLLKVVSG